MSLGTKSKIHPVVPWLSWLERGANIQETLTPRSRVQPPLEPFFLPFGYILFFFFLAETCFGDARIVRSLLADNSPMKRVQSAMRGRGGWSGGGAGGRQGVLTPLIPHRRAFPTTGRR